MLGQKEGIATRKKEKDRRGTSNMKEKKKQDKRDSWR